MTIYKANRKQVVERNLVLRVYKSVKVDYANYMYQQYVLNHKKWAIICKQSCQTKKLFSYIINMH